MQSSQAMQNSQAMQSQQGIPNIQNYSGLGKNFQTINNHSN